MLGTQAISKDVTKIEEVQSMSPDKSRNDVRDAPIHSRWKFDVVVARLLLDLEESSLLCCHDTSSIETKEKNSRGIFSGSS
jgi:hypothetical protein